MELTGSTSNAARFIGRADLEAAQNTAMRVSVPGAVLDMTGQFRQVLSDHGIVASDRRHKDSLDLLRGCCLFQDALLGLYQGSHRLKGVDEVTPSHRLNHAVLGKAMMERTFEELRLRTRLDSTMALLGAANPWEQLMGLLTEEQKEAAWQAAEQETQRDRRGTRPAEDCQGQHRSQRESCSATERQ